MRASSRGCHGVGTAVGLGLDGCVPSSGLIRSLHESAVARMATMKTSRASPTAATKYSAGVRPERRDRFLLCFTMRFYPR